MDASVSDCTQWSDDRVTNEQLATEIAGKGRQFAELLRDAHAQAADGRCAILRCGQPWPCRTCRRAVRALELLDQQERRHSRGARAKD